MSQVLRDTQHEKFLRWPSQMKKDPAKKDSTKYCEFHRDHGHRTDDCIKLRKEIEYLIRRGQLRRFVASEGRGQAPPSSPRHPAPTQHQQPLREIQVISGGFTGWRGVQLSPEGSSLQHQIRGDTRNESSIKTPSAGHYHNLLGLRHGRLPASP